MVGNSHSRCSHDMITHDMEVTVGNLQRVVTVGSYHSREQ